MKTILTIAAREYTERIKQRGFIIGTVLGVLLIVGLSFMFVVFGLISSTFTTSIAIVAPNAKVGATIEDTLHRADRSYRLTVVPQHSKSAQLPASVQAALKAKKYDAALVAYYDRDRSDRVHLLSASAERAGESERPQTVSAARRHHRRRQGRQRPSGKDAELSRFPPSTSTSISRMKRSSRSRRSSSISSCCSCTWRSSCTASTWRKA